MGILSAVGFVQGDYVLQLCDTSRYHEMLYRCDYF